MGEYNITFIIVILALAWVMQLALSSWQMKRYFQRLREMRREGTVSVGMAGSAWRRRIYAMLAVNARRQVVRAEVLEGWTVFAKPRPVPVLVGATIEQILDGEVAGLSSKQLAAFQQAAQFVRDTIEKQSQGQGKSGALEKGVRSH